MLTLMPPPPLGKFSADAHGGDITLQDILCYGIVLNCAWNGIRFLTRLQSSARFL